MGPLRGDGNDYIFLHNIFLFRREDGSPSWGRKLVSIICKFLSRVEKMGPLRGDGNFLLIQTSATHLCREDGSPSWGRKLVSLSL